ncbi:MAG TPA: sugar kinase, partial [Pelagibacterium sp.]|nr:sugar kinase [Pelagibacterium sp.]
MTSSEKHGRGPRLVIGSNPERNRAHNRRVVLEVIRTHGHMGRTEIARR